MLSFIRKALNPEKTIPIPAELPPYGFFGKSGVWVEVEKSARGYDAEGIFSKVKSSLGKVRDGLAVYERDSVLFDETQYSWPLLTALLKVASLEGKLHLVDFGGSLGSSYFQNRNFLNGIDLKWSVVEQAHFVEEGQNNFANEELLFSSSVEEALVQQPNTNVLLVSSTLQYLPDPFENLKQWLELPFKYIIFDRTSFFHKSENCLTLQKVPPVIYDAEYPAWFLNESEFLQYLNNGFEKICEWDALGGKIPIYQADGSIDYGVDKGMFFKAREN